MFEENVLKGCRKAIREGADSKCYVQIKNVIIGIKTRGEILLKRWLVQGWGYAVSLGD